MRQRGAMQGISSTGYLLEYSTPSQIAVITVKVNSSLTLYVLTVFEPVIYVQHSLNVHGAFILAGKKFSSLADSIRFFFFVFG